jgi:PKHD-type hydroxylase
MTKKNSEYDQPHHLDNPYIKIIERLKLKRISTLDKIFFLKIFTPDQCVKIIDTALNTWEEQESKLWNEKEQNFIVDPEIRNTTLFIPPAPEDDDLLLSTILASIKTFNDCNDGYKFDIVGMLEPPNMMRYFAPDIHPKGKPGKYDWHMDVGLAPVQSVRKLSYSILLNAGEYEGGELEFHIGNIMEQPEGQTSSDMVGTMIIFPSYLVHRIVEMTKGIRYALVGWVHGNSFR